MKKCKAVLVMVSILLSVFILPFTAQAKETDCIVTESSDTTISPRADVIVFKFRVYNGILQYRRWNETWGYWVDDKWMDIGPYEPNE